MPTIPKRKPFSRLSAAAKRVAIAQDVLKQIRAKHYDIECGTWLDIQEFDDDEARTIRDAGASFTQALLKGGKIADVGFVDRRDCTCCAVGAACASVIRIFNHAEVEMGYISDVHEAFRILERYFSRRQIDMIEGAFEQRTGSERTEAGFEEYTRATTFGNRYVDADKRAKAIFSNIVKNNGTFKP